MIIGEKSSAKERRSVWSKIILAGAVLVTGQVVYDHTANKSEPSVVLFNPLTWFATPIEAAMDRVNGDTASASLHIGPNVNISAIATDLTSTDHVYDLAYGAGLTVACSPSENGQILDGHKTRAQMYISQLALKYPNSSVEITSATTAALDVVRDEHQIGSYDIC